VIFQCDVPGGPVFTPDFVEEIASHELAEASTDPYPSFNNGADLAYVGFDTPHYAWEVWQQFQDELGDACEFFRLSNYQLTGSFPYWVQRIWSNASAAAGHNPCAPQPTEPYFNVTLFPEQEQDITVDLRSLFMGPPVDGGVDSGPPDGAADGGTDGIVHTRGFRAALNQSVTFQIGFFSDAQTSPIAVTGRVDPQLFPGFGTGPKNGAATVTIDHQASGLNGEKAYVTVTPTEAGQLGFQLLLLTVSTGSTTWDHYLPILISNQ
jgi:hypothetical protein